MPSCHPSTILAIGGQVLPAVPGVGLTGLAGGLGGTLVRAAETEPTPASWSLRGQALCAQATTIPPPVGGAASYLKAVQRVYKFGTLALCPSGKKVISGGGGRVGPGSFVLRRMGPTSDGRGWAVATIPAGRADVLAICANVTAGTPMRNYVGTPTQPITHTAASSSSAKLHFTACPAGMSLIGGWAQAVNENSGPPPAGVALTFSRDLQGKWAGQAREIRPTAAKWRLRVAATCASVSEPGPPPP